MNHNQSIKQNQRIQRISETTLVIGVDIAKFNHVARAFNYRGMELGKRCLFYNDESGLLHLLDWIKAIQLEQGYDDVILGIEPTGHYWFPMFHFLKEKGVQVVLVNPHHVKKSKELDDNSPTKNDIKDAKVVASLVRDGRYSTPQLPEGIYADLRVLMNQRDRVYEDLHRVKGRIHNWLDRFFPEYMQVFKGWEGKASLLTLQFFPLPQDVVAAGETVIVNLWKEEIKRAVGTKRAQLLCSKAARSIGITTGATAARHELSMYLELYTMLVKQMDDLMMLVEQLVQQIPGAVEIMTIPGIGLNTVAGFLSEVGDLSRYDHSQQIVSHAGLNLRENSSGLIDSLIDCQKWSGVFMKLWILSKVIIVTMTGFLVNGEILESASEINHPPELIEEMPDPETISPWVEYEIDVRNVFSDVDGDELVFSALSQSQSVAKVEVEGSFIKVMAQKAGKVTVIVTASDQRGGTVSTAYRFIVK